MASTRVAPQHPSAGRAGISLLTILLWLCAVAVVSLLAIPHFFNRPGVTLWHAVELLSRDLRSAQNRAAFHRAPATFRFEANGWSAEDAEGRPMGTGRGEPPIERAFGGIFEGVEIVRIEFGEDDALIFDAEGRALESGEVDVSFRGETHTLVLEEGSGLVTILNDGEAILQDDRRVNLGRAERP